MPKLVVVIDARKATQGAQVFAQAQQQMSGAAKQGTQQIKQSNQDAFKSIVSGLDMELERRKAVSTALKKGTDEARIEQRIQTALQQAQARGLTLTQQEIDLIKEKARASQELANQQAAAFRAQANEEKDKTPEAKRKRVKEFLNETRGWVGDMGDAFAQVGQSILGLNDSQTKVIDTTIYMTEKGMALGEVFGPVGSIIGGVAGGVLALVSASREASKEMNKLTRETNMMHSEFQKARAALITQEDLEDTYLGQKKLRVEFEELSHINVSDITEKIESITKARNAWAASGRVIAQGDHTIRGAVEDLLQDKTRALNDVSKAMGETIKRNKEAQEVEAVTTKQMQEAWQAAESEVKKAENAIGSYQVKLNLAAIEGEKAIQAAYAEFENSDKSDAAAQKLSAAIGKVSDKAKALTTIAQLLGDRHAQALTKAKEKHDQYNTALAKTPSLLQNIAGAINDSLSDATGGKLQQVIGHLLDADKWKAQIDKKEKAKEAAKRDAEAIRDILKSQSQNADAAEAVKKKYEEAGADAADLEAAVLGKSSGKKLSAAQMKQLREDTAREIQANKDLAASKKAVADAEAEKKRAEEKTAEALRAKQDIVKATEEEIEETKTLARALAISNEEYDKQAFILPRLKKLRDAGASEKEIDAEKARAEALYNELEGIKKVQKAREDAIAAVDTAQEQSLEKQTQMQSDWLNYATSTVDSFGAQLNEALWEGEQDWGAFFKSVGKDLTAMLIKMLLMATLKAVLSGGGSALGSAGAALGAGAIGDLIVGSTFHNGGTVGLGGGSRMIDPAAYINAPRYHNGTPYVGLRPNEVPAILQPGEVVKTQAQERADQRRRGGVAVHFHLDNVQDSRGFMRNVHQNAGTIRRVIGSEEAY